MTVYGISSSTSIYYHSQIYAYSGEEYRYAISVNATYSVFNIKATLGESDYRVISPESNVFKTEYSVHVDRRVDQYLLTPSIKKFTNSSPSMSKLLENLNEKRL